MELHNKNFLGYKTSRKGNLSTVKYCCNKLIKTDYTLLLSLEQIGRYEQCSSESTDNFGMLTGLFITERAPDCKYESIIRFC